MPSVDASPILTDTSHGAYRINSKYTWLTMYIKQGLINTNSVFLLYDHNVMTLVSIKMEKLNNISSKLSLLHVVIATMM